MPAAIPPHDRLRRARRARPARRASASRAAPPRGSPASPARTKSARHPRGRDRRADPRPSRCPSARCPAATRTTARDRSTRLCRIAKLLDRLRCRRSRVLRRRKRFAGKHHQAVDEQEEPPPAPASRRAGAPELEDEAENPDRDRSDDQQPADALVAVVAQAAAHDAGDERAHDRVPLRAIEDDQRQRRAEMQHDDEGEKRRARAIDVVPVQQRRDEDRVAEARDRKELADALQQRENERLGKGHGATVTPSAARTGSRLTTRRTSR